MKKTNLNKMNLSKRIILFCGLLGISISAVLIILEWDQQTTTLSDSNDIPAAVLLVKNSTPQSETKHDLTKSENEHSINPVLDSKIKNQNLKKMDENIINNNKEKISNKDSRDIIELGQATINHSTKIQKETSVLMNDPNIQQAWGLKKSDAEKAWSISKGSKKVIVAIIDTGADVKHEDLKNNFWVNTAEIPNNGIDDDKNGFIDDVYGWNFVNNDNDLTDNHGHGTHIAGIIGAEANNGKGIVGISPEVSLMILKYYDPKVPNTDNLRNTILAIKYATKMGANIINYSGGGTEFSQDEKAAIEEAKNQGILFVAAAGNERSNSDKHKYFPADYGLSNIISVTAIDPDTKVLDSSNYGVETVDIAAPGQNIVSTLPGNKYGHMTGTSQATAFVSGAAVLVMAHKNNSDFNDVKKFILATGDSQSHLLSKTKTARKLNLYKALTMLDSGTSVSGVIAANTANIEPLSPDLSSTSDSSGNTNGANSNTSIKSINKPTALNGISPMFGRSLLESLENNNIRLKKKN